MKKPMGYDEAPSYGEFETLPAGGYKCIIVKAEELESSANGKAYLKLSLDVAEGKYKDIYKKKFETDTRADKKWSCVWNVFEEGYELGTTNPKFKGLITAIEASNPNFKFDFIHVKDLENKKVGIVFREEEFIGEDKGTYSASKPFYALSYDKVESTKVPAPKKVKQESNPFVANNSFTPVEDDDLPF